MNVCVCVCGGGGGGGMERESAREIETFILQRLM